jgi:hypothetical protein
MEAGDGDDWPKAGVIKQSSSASNIMRCACKFPMLIVGVLARASVRQLCLLCALRFFVEDNILPLICPTSQTRFRLSE